jgi:hypothetical protein
MCDCLTLATNNSHGKISRSLPRALESSLLRSSLPLALVVRCKIVHVVDKTTTKIGYYFKIYFFHDPLKICEDLELLLIKILIYL